MRKKKIIFHNSSHMLVVAVIGLLDETVSLKDYIDIENSFIITLVVAYK